MIFWALLRFKLRLTNIFSDQFFSLFAPTKLFKKINVCMRTRIFQGESDVFKLRQKKQSDNLFLGIFALNSDCQLVKKFEQSAN